MHAPLETCRSRGVTSATSAPATPIVRPKAVVRGTGLLTALGVSTQDTWDALLAGGCIRTHTAIPLPDDGSRRPRVNQLACRAARQAVGESGWTSEDLRSDETALVVGTSKGPIEHWTPPPLDLVGAHGVYGLAATATDIAQDLQIGQGPRLTISAACATGLHALIRGTMLLQSGQARRVLVVAAESSLGPLFTGSFRRLGVLARDLCRPFDQHRTGFLMSEGAAAVCLEPASAADDRSFGIEHYALGADATHLTGGDRDGDTLTHLITRVLDHRPVDFIHAHGTGTEINDATELAAIERSLSAIDQHPCPVYSHKAAIGHSLGAAGLAAVVLSARIHVAGTIPPNVNTTSPLPTRIARLDSAPGSNPPATSHNTGYVKFDQGGQKRGFKRSLVVAAGFGGAAAVVSLVS